MATKDFKDFVPALTELTNTVADGTEVFPVINDPAGVKNKRKMTLDSLRMLAGLKGSPISGAPFIIGGGKTSFSSAVGAAQVYWVILSKTVTNDTPTVLKAYNASGTEITFTLPVDVAYLAIYRGYIVGVNRDIESRIGLWSVAGGSINLLQTPTQGSTLSIPTVTALSNIETMPTPTVDYNGVGNVFSVTVTGVDGQTEDWFAALEFVVFKDSPF